jgi:hypothetical protein
MTKEQMAVILADEMMEDMDRFAANVRALSERWSQYGEQYEHLLPPDKKAQMALFFDHFMARMNAMELA